MKADWMASISLDLSGGSGSVECQANFNFQVSLVYFPRKSKQNPKADITALRKPAIRDEFSLKVKNKYDCLMEENCKQIPEKQGRKRQNEWELLKITITHT